MGQTTYPVTKGAGFVGADFIHIPTPHDLPLMKTAYGAYLTGVTNGF